MEEDEKKMKVSLRERWEALKLAIKWTYRSSKFLTFIVFFVTILGGLIVIIEPYVFKLIIDYITESSKLNLASKLGLGVTGVLIIYGIARIVQSILWDIQTIIKRIHSQKLDRYVAKEMMNKVSSLDEVYFEDPNYYNTLTKANSNMWRINEFFWQFTFFLGELISILIIMGVLLRLDWKIVGLILLGTLPSIFLYLKSTKLSWGIFESSAPVSRHAHYYRNLMMEDSRAVKEIKLFGLRSHFLTKFDSLMGNYLKKQQNLALKEFVFLTLIGIIEGIFSVFAAWLVIQSFTEGRISVGDVAFFWALLFQFAGHSRWVVRMIGEINTSATFTTPFVKILNFKPQIVEKENPESFPDKIKEIEFRNVSFKYPKAKKYALKDVSFSIKPGDSIALVGENGSGKTTLIKLLCRLYDVSEGEILIDGINIKDYSLDELYNNLGVIFQDFMKYEALVQENIGFGKLEEMKKKKGIHKASVKSEAWEFIKDLEGKYKTHLGKTLKDEGTELSVGQWQKIALARAFFRDAQILILDEPTAAVDAKTEYKIFQRFEELTKGKISFLISHRFSTVRMANKIIVINKGEIIEIGNHYELLRKNGEYAKMFKLQAEGYK